jgi:hypothetical protein
MASWVIERASQANPVRAVGKAGTDISQALHDALLAGGEPVRILRGGPRFSTIQMKAIR